MTEDERRDFDAMRSRLLEAVSGAVAGTEWAPPEGGVLTEAVVVMVWMGADGDNGISYVPATLHWWSTLGLLTDALRRHTDESEDE